MIDLGQIAALVDAGGWTLFVMTVALAAVSLHRKWLVPGWIYQREIDSNADLRKSLRALSTAFTRLAAQKRDA